MNTQEIIRFSSQHLADFSRHTFDLLDISKPISADVETTFRESPR